MPARDDDDKRRGLRFLSILYSRWPAILQLLVAAMGAACLAAYSVRRWGAVPAEDVLSSELDTVVSVGKMGNVGGREVREERVEPQPEVLLTFEELDNEDDTEDNEDNEDTEEKSLKDLEPLEPEENGAVDRKKIEAAEMRNVEETESLARTYKKLNPGAEISRMAAVQLKMNLCGSFVQQRLQMISILMIGLFLGAQVVLPSEIGSQQRPLGDILDLEQIKQSMQKVYARHWCSRRQFMVFPVWCSHSRISAILTATQLAQFEADHEIFIETMPLPNNVTNFQDIQTFGEKIWLNRFPNGIKKVDLLKVERLLSVEVDCHFYKKIRFSEPELEYRKFWRISDEILLNKRIVAIQEMVQRKLFHNFASIASQRARAVGFSHPQDPKFTVLEVRSDLCSNERCVDLGNILLSEGVHPALPLYVAFSSAESLQRYQSSMRKTSVLQSIFTVVTKDMLDLDLDDVELVALDFLMAEGAGTFVGPSRSLASSFILLSRARSNKHAFHYDGERTLLEAEGLLRPQQSTVEVMRTPLKWLFTLSSGAELAVWNMSLAAIRSARISSETIIPVCLTDATPSSEMARSLVRMGVRVLYHQPEWWGQMTPIFNRWKQKSDQKWRFAFPDFDGIQSSMLRIDIPIVGLLDRFALYTDVDVLFQRPVNWDSILQVDKAAENPTPRQSGLPEFFAMTSEFLQSFSDKMDTSVMLMNLRILRDTHKNFTNFLFNPELVWDFNTADPAGYKSYYRNKGKLVANFLPFTLNWKFYWNKTHADDADSAILHFHGPKCDTDIIPFLKDGAVTFEAFRSILDHCNGSSAVTCDKLCKAYHAHLAAAYKTLHGDLGRNSTRGNSTRSNSTRRNSKVL